MKEASDWLAGCLVFEGFFFPLLELLSTTDDLRLLCTVDEAYPPFSLKNPRLAVALAAVRL